MKRFLVWLLLCAMLLTSLISCNKEQAPVDETENDAETTADEVAGSAEDPSESGDGAPAVKEYLSLLEDGNRCAPLVRSEDYAPGSEYVTLIDAFNRSIKAATETGLLYKTDYVGRNETLDPTLPELLVGVTNREESKALQERLEMLQFAIRTTENKVVIVGWDEIALKAGCDYFLAGLESGEFGEIASGTLKVKVGIEYFSDPSDTRQFELALLSSDTLIAKSTVYVGLIEEPKNMTWSQGGYTDGKYYYQAFIRKDAESNEANNDVVIVKYDMQTRAIVQTSEYLPLNHANDIAYNSKLDRFVICHNNPNRTKVSIIDPETLTIEETKMIDEKIYSIDYNATTDRYVLGLSGGQSFMIVDSNFKKVKGPLLPTERTVGYTTQGVTTDDNYIYFVLYNKNVITVYDWDGNFVTLIELDVGNIEPENISIVGGVFYVGCGTGSGTKVFAVSDLAPKE